MRRARRYSSLNTKLILQSWFSLTNSGGSSLPLRSPSLGLWSGVPAAAPGQQAVQRQPATQNRDKEAELHKAPENILKGLCDDIWTRAWTSKHHFKSFHTPTACTRAPTSMVPTQHVRTLRSQRALVRSGQSTQHCASYRPMRTRNQNMANRSPHHSDRGYAAPKKPFGRERTRHETTSSYLPLQRLSFAAQKRLMSVYSQKTTLYSSVG